jgi:hypothetical protein
LPSFGGNDFLDIMRGEHRRYLKQARGGQVEPHAPHFIAIEISPAPSTSNENGFLSF